MVATLTVVASGTFTTSSATKVITTSASAPSGAIALAAAGMDATASLTIGIDSVVPASGAVSSWATKDGANRAGSVSSHEWSGDISTTIPTSTNVTFTMPSVHVKSGFMLAYVSDAGSSTPNMHTGDTASGNTGDVSYGYNGSGNINQALPATTVDNCLVVAVVGVTGTATLTPTGSWTLAGEARTSTGTSDRGVAILTMTQVTAGVPTVTATLSSGSWSLNAQAFEPVAATGATFAPGAATASASGVAAALTGDASFVAPVATSTSRAEGPTFSGDAVSTGDAATAAAVAIAPAMTGDAVYLATGAIAHTSAIAPTITGAAVFAPGAATSTAIARVPEMVGARADELAPPSPATSTAVAVAPTFTGSAVFAPGAASAGASGVAPAFTSGALFVPGAATATATAVAPALSGFTPAAPSTRRSVSRSRVRRSVSRR